MVDDCNFMRKMLQNIINKIDGYEVVGSASNGKEAIIKCVYLNPNIVTMDITMPHMTGIEATKKIMQINPEIKIIMVTAMGQDCLLVEAAEAGAKGYIVKPFTEIEVIKALKNLE